jgi:hypothetical protein
MDRCGEIYTSNRTSRRTNSWSRNRKLTHHHCVRLGQPVSRTIIAMPAVGKSHGQPRITAIGTRRASIHHSGLPDAILTTFDSTVYGLHR